jgi:hypothetical protein
MVRSSLLFALGLGLMLAGAASIYFTRSEHVQEAAGFRQQPVAFSISYTDYDLRLPLGFTVGGLALVGVAIWRTRSR